MTLETRQFVPEGYPDYSNTPDSYHIVSEMGNEVEIDKKIFDFFDKMRLDTIRENVQRNVDQITHVYLYQHADIQNHLTKHTGRC